MSNRFNLELFVLFYFILVLELFFLLHPFGTSSLSCVQFGIQKRNSKSNVNN